MIPQLKKLFCDKTISYTSITSGTHSQYFFLYDKIRQLDPGHSETIFWNNLSVKLVFDSGKVTRPSSDPLIVPAMSFSSPNFRAHLLDYKFSIKLYLYANGPATGKSASTFFTLFLCDCDILLHWTSKVMHLSIRDQLDPLNTWTQKTRTHIDPAYKQSTILTKSRVSAIRVKNFIPHSKLLAETEGFLTGGAAFKDFRVSDQPLLKPQSQTSPVFPFQKSPSINFNCL